MEIAAAINPVIDWQDPRPKHFTRCFDGIRQVKPSEGYYSKIIRFKKIQARPRVVSVNRLINLELSSAIDFILEPDADGYIARNPDLPLFSFGEDMAEAIASLKHEIESLYDDLMEDDNFTEEWAPIKNFLSNIVVAPE